MKKYRYSKRSIAQLQKTPEKIKCYWHEVIEALRGKPEQGSDKAPFSAPRSGHQSPAATYGVKPRSSLFH